MIRAYFLADHFQEGKPVQAVSFSQATMVLDLSIEIVHIQISTTAVALAEMRACQTDIVSTGNDADTQLPVLGQTIYQPGEISDELRRVTLPPKPLHAQQVMRSKPDVSYDDAPLIQLVPSVSPSFPEIDSTDEVVLTARNSKLTQL